MKSCRPILAGAAAGASVAFAPSAWAQQLGQGQSADIPVLRVLLALGLCLALATGAAFLLRRRLQNGVLRTPAPSKRLRLMEAVRLTHQNHLCLIECDDQLLVIASTPHGASLVKELDRPQPDEAPHVG